MSTFLFGANYGPSTFTFPLSWKNEDLYIGSSYVDDGWIGYIDDVRIYCRALSSNEITQIAAIRE